MLKPVDTGRLRYIDLFDFAGRIYTNITDAAIRADSVTLQSAITDLVLAERHSANMAGSHGVSIFFPAILAVFTTLHAMILPWVLSGQALLRHRA